MTERKTWPRVIRTNRYLRHVDLDSGLSLPIYREQVEAAEIARLQPLIALALDERTKRPVLIAPGVYLTMTGSRKWAEATLWIDRGQGACHPDARIWIARHAQGGARAWRETGSQIERPPVPWVASRGPADAGLVRALGWAWASKGDAA